LASFYIFSKAWNFSKPTIFFFELFVYKSVERLILEQNPQKVLSSYYFFTLVGFKVAKTNNLKISFETIVADPFSPKPVWFLDKNCNYTVFSKKLRK